MSWPAGSRWKRRTTHWRNGCVKWRIRRIQLLGMESVARPQRSQSNNPSRKSGDRLMLISFSHYFPLLLCCLSFWLSQVCRWIGSLLSQIHVAIVLRGAGERGDHWEGELWRHGLRSCWPRRAAQGPSEWAMIVLFTCVNLNIAIYMIYYYSIDLALWVSIR